MLAISYFEFMLNSHFEKITDIWLHDKQSASSEGLVAAESVTESFTDTRGCRSIEK